MITCAHVLIEFATARPEQRFQTIFPNQHFEVETEQNLISISRVSDGKTVCTIVYNLAEVLLVECTT
jgi:hypothetical protein